jgi:hypothetical protein
MFDHVTSRGRSTYRRWRAQFIDMLIGYEGPELRHRYDLLCDTTGLDSGHGYASRGKCIQRNRSAYGIREQPVNIATEGDTNLNRVDGRQPAEMVAMTQR